MGTRTKTGAALLVGVVGAVLAVSVLPGTTRAGVNGARPAFADTVSGGSTKGVTVSGKGIVSGTPDTLVVSMGVEVSKPNVSDALSTANGRVASVSSALRDRGVAKADLQTSGLQVNPQWSYDNNSQHIVGYTVSEQLTAKIRSLSKSGDTLDAAIRAGGDDVRVQSVNVDLEHDDALVSAARQRAFADAKTKAQQYADLAGRPLGKVVSVSESVQSSTRPVPYAMDAAKGAASGGVAAPSVPVQAGQQDVSVDVTVVWDLG